LKTLQDKNFDIKKGIIVIDDPISSLDSNALYNAFGFMKNRTKDALQLFILTHNHSFFKEVKNWWKAGRSQASRNRSINSSYYMLKNMVVDGQRIAKLQPLDNMLKESLFQNFPYTFFQHRMKHAISNSPLKTTLSLSYLLANFLNPIFNHAKNRSIVPLFE